MWLRLHSAALLALSIFLAENLIAQDQVPAPVNRAAGVAPQANVGAAPMAEVERVIVTGSNIPTAEEVGPRPVDTYRKDDIIRMGVRSSTDFVQKLPAATGSTLNENQTNGGDGRAEINLRGIIAKETLVMQDGRRLAPVGFAGATVDLNTFPIGLIDHVDVLKDGASAIYGSDAVGGVFNVWLIHKFRGLELYATYGNTNLGFANDMGEERAYLLAGTGDDKTDIVFYAEFYNRAGLASRDADISHDPDAVPWGGQDFRSGNFAGRVQGFVYQPKLNGGSLTPTPHAFPNVRSNPEYVPRLSLPREKQLFNFADITPSIAAVDREYLYGSLNRKICDQYLELFADFKYARTAWDSSLAPAPFAPDPFTDANHPFGISSRGISVPTQNAFNPFTLPDYISPGGFDPRFPQTQASAPPPGTQFTTGVRYRGLEAGLRTDKVTTDNYEVTAGLKGNLGEFGNYLRTWDWETGFRYNDDHRLERFGGIVNSNALRNALLDTDPATAFNPFGINQNTKAVIERVFVTTNHVGTTTLELEDAKLTGDLFNLPGGPVSFAFGSEHRREHTSDNPDALSASGQTLGSINFGPTKGSRDVWSAYWEVRVPVTSPAWNFPGLYSLELDYQERYENFSDFGSTERPKFSARWQPIDSAWTIRATYNEAFHAPALGELFAAAVTDFPALFDPVTGEVAQPQQVITGNPNLKPETAYEWTYGAIVTPGKWWSLLQGLTLVADFYHIDLRAIALRPSPQFIVFHEAEFPGQVIRDPTDNTLLFIFNPQANLGSFIEEGWDYEAVYSFETSRLGHGDLGTLTATLNWNYLDRAVRQEVPNGPSEIVVGKGFGGFFGGPLTHNRWYASLFYDGAAGTRLGGLQTGFTVHFVGQYWDDYFSTFFNPHPRNPNDPNSLPIGFSDRKVREWITLDWILNYTFSFPAPAGQNEVAGAAKDGGKNVTMKDGKDKNVLPVSTAQYNPCGWRAWLNNTTITFGLNNVFGEEPPFVAGYVGLNNYDEQAANPKGRIWYVALKKRF